MGAEAWTGDGPKDVLGVPVGYKAFVQKWLADKGKSHAQFFQSDPSCSRSAKRMVALFDVRRTQGAPSSPSEVFRFCQDWL